MVADVNEDDLESRRANVVDSLRELDDAVEKIGFVDARFRGSPSGVTWKSGNVMKKRQPNVVPKNAPSTD